MKESTGAPRTMTDIQYRYNNDVGILVTNISRPHVNNRKLFDRFVREMDVESATPTSVFYKGQERRDVVVGAMTKGEIFSKFDELTEKPCPVFWCKMKRWLLPNSLGAYRSR